VYPTSHAKSNTTSKHHHSRVNSGTVATTFQHTRTHSIHRYTNHQNSPTRSGKVKSQHHSNTQSRELPRYLSRTARVIAGDTFHYPHHSTPTPEAKYARKKHHLCGVWKSHRETGQPSNPFVLIVLNPAKRNSRINGSSTTTPSPLGLVRFF